jgi:hypothetical protein
MAQSKTLSTGILAPDSQLDGVRIDVVNLNPTLSQTVTVEVFGWGVDPVSSNPSPVLVNPSSPTAISPNTHQSFTASLFFVPPRPFYEIRVTIPDDPQLVVNCFAFDANGRVINGNTVLHEALANVAAHTGESTSHLTGMIDAVADAGADPTGLSDSATAFSNAVAMCFGYPTMAALDKALPPATKARQPTKWLYIPPGTYKLLHALALTSMQGLLIRGGGRFITVLAVESGSPDAPLLAGLDLNGVAFCTFSDFGVCVGADGDVRALIYLHWDPGRAA